MDAETEERTDSKPGQSDQSKAMILAIAFGMAAGFSDHLASPTTKLAPLLLVYVLGYWIPPRDPKGFWHHAVAGYLLWGVLIPLKLGPFLLHDTPVYLAYGVPCLLAFLMVFFALKYLEREITPLRRWLTPLVVVYFFGWFIF